MMNIGMLYRFEIKKILKNRLAIAMMIFTIIMVFIEAFAPGLITTREMAKAQKTLEGRQIDDSLLQEMYPLLLENGKTWNADNGKYYGIAHLERMIISDDDANLADYSAKDLYEKRKEDIFAEMEKDALDSQELAWWKQQESKIRLPFVYHCSEGALNLAQGLSGILLCIMLISTLCLSTIFTVEHRQRTDQIVLSCRNGREITFLVKIAAGLSTVIGLSVLSVALLAVLIILLYGLDGMNAIVQLELPMSAYPLTMGQFIAIQMVIIFTAGILFATFAMTVSEVLKNSMATTGIMVGLFIFSQVEIIPPQYRIMLQIRSMLPSNQSSVWALAEHRLIHLGDIMVTGFAAAPVIYILISILFIVIGGVIYNRFQVSGR